MKKLLGALGAAIALLLFVSEAQAITYAGTTAFTCTDFTAAGTGSSTLNRDNTGLGEESFEITVTDGGGGTLYDQTFQNALGTYAGGLIGTTPYTSAPHFNPLKITVTSLAGNGLPALVGYTATGSCAGLPVFNAAGIPASSTNGLIGLAILLLGAGLVAVRRRSYQR